MKRYLFLSLLILVLSSPLTSALDVDSLLIKSIGGPEALETARNLNSVWAEGEINLSGQVGRFELIWAAPTSVYMKLSIGPLTVVQAFDGETAWMQSLNNQVSKLGGFEERELIKEAYFQSFSYLFDDRLPGGKQYRGMDRLDGKQYHVVAFYPLNRDTILTYFDPETAHAEVIVSRLDNMTLYTRNSDFREVRGGLVMAFQSAAEAVGAPLSTQLTIEDVAFNQPFDPAMFTMPGTGGEQFPAPGQADSVVIPIDYYNGHLYIKGSVSGSHAVWFLLDTGASSTMLHRPAFPDTELPVAGTIKARGIGGFDEVNLVTADSITIGPLTFHEESIGAADLGSIARLRSDTLPFGGVLGYDFISRFPMLVDYLKSTLTVYDPEKFSAPAGGTEVTFFLTMQVPTITAEAAGAAGDFIVDLGNRFGLVLHSEFVARTGVRDSISNLRQLGGGLGGMGGGVGGEAGLLSSFEFGDIDLYDVRVLLPEESGGLTGSKELAGNIGNIVLEQFKVLIDYNNSRLLFYPGETPGK